MVLLITKRTETISLEYCAYKLLDMYDVFFEIRIMIKFFFFSFFFFEANLFGGKTFCQSAAN